MNTSSLIKLRKLVGKCVKFNVVVLLVDDFYGRCFVRY